LVERPKKKKSKKKKLKLPWRVWIHFTYLRSLESDDEEIESKYLTWKEVVDWYLEQREEEIGDSMEEPARTDVKNGESRDSSFNQCRSCTHVYRRQSIYQGGGTNDQDCCPSKL
jgi:hypothetical protein